MNPWTIVDGVILVFGRIMLAIEQSLSPKTGMRDEKRMREEGLGIDRVG
ncbi:hypothetical protein [Mongoliibacter ruber]|nr:hypothetical protein [Mongoliibacter ruber]